MPNPIIDNDGNKYWYVNGKCHRLDGPAIEMANGYKSWYIHDKRHRLDGPAIERPNGYNEWYVNGKSVNEWYVNDVELSGPLDLLEYGAKLEDIAEYLTPREIAQCRTQK